jgi:hypothetical protein
MAHCSVTDNIGFLSLTNTIISTPTLIFSFLVIFHFTSVYLTLIYRNYLNNNEVKNNLTLYRVARRVLKILPCDF